MRKLLLLSIMVVGCYGRVRLCVCRRAVSLPGDGGRKVVVVVVAVVRVDR